MLNVCFGDSERGMLKYALEGENVTYSYRLLDLGHIPLKNFENARREWINYFFGIHPMRKRTKIWKSDCKRFADIIKTVNQEKEVRIWYASNPCSMCGFYHLVYSLQNIDCKIFVVEMPTSIGFREPPFDKSWGEADPFTARECLQLERELSITEQKEIAQNWETLAKENEELRLNINGTITSLPIHYLDEEIMSYVPKDKEFKLGSLVGSMIGKSKHAISDSFIAGRIEVLIDGGFLVVVGERPKNRQDYYLETTIRLATEYDIKERRKKVDYVSNFLSALNIDVYAIGEAIQDGTLEKSYNLIMAKPKMTKKQALKKLHIEEYVPNPIPHKYRNYNNEE